MGYVSLELTTLLGASDQIAFGTLQDMRIWFNMYNYHNELLEYARDGKAFSPFGGCEDIPAGPSR